MFCILIRLPCLSRCGRWGQREAVGVGKGRGNRQFELVPYQIEVRTAGKPLYLSIVYCSCSLLERGSVEVITRIACYA